MPETLQSIVSIIQSSLKFGSVFFVLAAIDADFAAINDTHILMILWLHFAKLGIALFPVSFSVFVVFHFDAAFPLPISGLL